MSSSKIFNQVQHEKLRSNVFDLTHDKKLTLKFGQLVPIFLMDCVPGDKVSIKSNVMVRFAPMIAPVMHRVNVYTHYFWVPNRILWPQWENFITGGESGNDVSVAPYMQPDLSGAQLGSLHDYLGLPVQNTLSGTDHAEVNALPYAAYQAIYSEYYRDQNLQPEVNWNLGDGSNQSNPELTPLRKRAWQHDYFTSSLPFQQKGQSVTLPLGDIAPVFSYNDQNPPPGGFPITPQTQFFRDLNTGLPGATGSLQHNNTAGTTTSPANDPVYADVSKTAYADLSNATAATIVDLRRAVKLQEWLEKNARGGSRYVESIKVHFGVTLPDYTAQRPVYIGGSSQNVKISEVLSNAGYDNAGASGTVSVPQANMSGHGVSIGSGGYNSYYAQEHGYVMGIMSIMPMTAYQQGIPKHFLRKDRFDYYWKEFAHIGEQPIENKELYYQANAAQDDATFGWTPRYAEYKHILNSVHGDFKETLNFWHMGRIFSSLPALNSDFIEMDDAEVNRIFAVYNNDGTPLEFDNLWCHVLNEVKAKRPMPVFGNPKW